MIMEIPTIQISMVTVNETLSIFCYLSKITTTTIKIIKMKIVKTIAIMITTTIRKVNATLSDFSRK